ncbi:MAG: TonB-dependent receptor, partial [Myxococcales bacterium]|nr:TonB-dependent receptor [Myxococcales bacterium]
DADADADAEADTDAPPTADTGIRGRIVDAQTGEGLPDAVVIARAEEGGISNAVTNDTGGYVIVVPPGVYSVLSYTDLYHGARMPRVVVRSARWRDLTLTLDPIDADAVAEEIEIVYRADTSSAAAQDQLRAAASGIGEGMGAQQMSRSGASDAGAAARNVVGVTLEGTNLNIRGLGGRYTVVLLNGVQLPSTDPDVPSVDLDLFPTAVIDNLMVSKAFLPNLPGNFAGGVLDIRTVRFPQEFTFQLEASVGLNTLSSFQDRLTYGGGDTDWLGYDDGTRAYPSIPRDRPLVIDALRGNGYSSWSEIEPLAEQFSNNWQYSRTMAPPNFGLGATLGDSVDLGGGNRFGYLVTAFYDVESARQLGISRPRPSFGDGGELIVTNDYQLETGALNVQLGALGTASVELGQDDVVSLLTMYNRNATDETLHTIGTNFELGMGEEAERWQLQYIGRQLWFNQLRGDHRNMFGTQVRTRWNLYGSYGGREEPDRRTITYGSQGGTRRWLDKSQSGERFYSDLTQLDLGGALDVRFPLWSEGWGTIGGHYRFTDRDFGIRRLRMIQDPTNPDQSVYQAPVEELFDDQAIGTITRIREFTRSNDSYHAELGYYAAYAMLETPIAGPLSFTGGARFEAQSQLVQSQSPFVTTMTTPEEEEENRTDRTDFDVLPAATFRLEVADSMVVRAAYGMTVARPQIRELAPYQYYDFIRDANIQGNPDLARTLIQNVDLRWEWFFGEGEILAISAFYKYFDRPIELQILSTNGDSQFINADVAHNVGGEAEFRFNFRNFHRDLSFMTFGANLAVIWSTVQLPEEMSGVVGSERPLFGQAPYVANLSLGVDEPGSGITASLVYNVVGPRITGVGTRAGTEGILPNIVRDPFHSLDFILGWRIDEHLGLRLKLRNLLFQEQTYHQGDLLVRSINPGMSGSIGIRYSY